MKREPTFKTEAELCAAYIEWVIAHGWTPYAETEGWDILLAHPDGTQIGIQAKLRFNLNVLQQAVENSLGWSATGPDFRAILVPEDQGSHDLCDALGLTLIRPRINFNRKPDFEPDLTKRSAWRKWHYCNPEKRHELPAYVPDVAAGVPAPAQLTTWKIGALRISALLELRGYVTREDFRYAGIDHRRWAEAWLEAVPEKPGAWRWLEGHNRGFQNQHPTIYPKIRAEVEEHLKCKLSLL